MGIHARGECRFTVLDGERGAYEADLTKGDIWYAPKCRPHSIQGVGKGGCEFMLIFDDGNLDLPAFGLVGSYTKGGGGQELWP